MGATQSVATIRVFCIRNNDHNVHYWNYPDMPAGWNWESVGVGDYELMHPTEDEAATVEECFRGDPTTIESMKTYLQRIYQGLYNKEIIDKYVITEQVMLGQTFWERLQSIFKSGN